MQMMGLHPSEFVPLGSPPHFPFPGEPLNSRDGLNLPGKSPDLACAPPLALYGQRKDTGESDPLVTLGLEVLNWCFCVCALYKKLGWGDSIDGVLLVTLTKWGCGKAGTRRAGAPGPHPCPVPALFQCLILFMVHWGCSFFSVFLLIFSFSFLDNFYCCIFMFTNFFCII